MKKIIVALSVISLFTSCGKSKTGKQIADKLCDCSKKANGLPASDPGRAQAQKDCSAKAVEAWSSVKDDIEKSKEYNEVIGKCAEEQIMNSFGK